MQQTCSVDDQWVFDWESFGGLTSPLGSWQLGSVLVAIVASAVLGRWYGKTVGTGNHWKTKGAKNDQTGESSSLLIVTHAIAIVAIAVYHMGLLENRVAINNPYESICIPYVFHMFPRLRR
jgi:hypothetical protein